MGYLSGLKAEGSGGEGMAYLNCPECRLTVYRPLSYGSAEDCPRCRAKLGKVSPLFRSSVPARLLGSERITEGNPANTLRRG
jgi:hypothetical protein